MPTRIFAATDNMKDHSTYDTNTIPSGHEEVSDDLLIYSLPNWTSPSEDHEGNGRVVGPPWALILAGGATLALSVRVFLAP